MSKKKELVINNKKLNSLQRWFFYKDDHFMQRFLFEIPAITTASLAAIAILYSVYMGDLYNIIRIPLEVIGGLVIYAILIERFIFSTIYETNMNSILAEEAITKKYLVNSDNLFKAYRYWRREVKEGCSFDKFEEIITCSYGEEDIDIIKRNMIQHKPIIAASMEDPTMEELYGAIKQAAQLEKKIKIRKNIDFKSLSIKEVRDFYAAHKNIDLNNNFKNRIIDLKTQEEIIDILNNEYKKI